MGPRYQHLILPRGKAPHYDNLPDFSFYALSILDPSKDNIPELQQIFLLLRQCMPLRRSGPPWLSFLWPHVSDGAGGPNGPNGSCSGSPTACRAFTTSSNACRGPSSASTPAVLAQSPSSRACTSTNSCARSSWPRSLSSTSISRG
jgi:hypothetical protein